MSLASEMARILLEISMEVATIPPPKTGLCRAEHRTRLLKAARINRLLEQLRQLAAQGDLQQVGNHLQGIDHRHPAAQVPTACHDR